jgi:TatD DNase family protein
VPAVAQARIYDAHNHLHDPRFGGRQAELLRACAAEGLVRMVVNGSCEEDWPAVLALARTFPQVLPSFGFHPWYLHQRTAQWAEVLVRFLETIPSAVGEIGLDRWKPGLAYASQEEVFQVQLRIAAERNLPLSIHCLRAWGRLFDLLRANPRPRCGFLLHSYGGPKEMVAEFVRLGAYFGFPGYFLQEHKARQRDTFKQIPHDRLLLETDAPDQPLGPPHEAAPPPVRGSEPAHRYPLTDSASDQPINHPANLAAIYRGLGTVLDLPPESLATTVEQNFHRLFGCVDQQRF